MSAYYLPGYKPPKGITESSQVKAYQKMLKVDADGVWGPKTQAAYEQWNMASGRKPQFSAPMGATKPDQIKTWQKIVGTDADGVWGPKSQSAYEKWQNENIGLDAAGTPRKNKTRSTADWTSGDATYPLPSRDMAYAQSRRKNREFFTDADEPVKEKISPYTPPLGLTRPDQIKTMQGIIGAEIDGVWGPKSQKAYEKWSDALQTTKNANASSFAKRAVSDEDASKPHWREETGNFEADSVNICGSIYIADIQKQLNREGYTGSDGKLLEVTGLIDDNTAYAMEKSGGFKAETKVYAGKEAREEIVKLAHGLGIDIIGVGATTSQIMKGDIPGLIKMGMSGTLGLTVGSGIYDLSLLISAQEMYRKNGKFTLTKWKALDTPPELDWLLSFSSIEP